MTTITRPRWELLRCSNANCDHEHVRQAAGRLVQPCKDCKSPMIVLSLEVAHDAARESFSFEDMTLALRAAARTARRLSTEPSATATERAKHAGRVDAYLDAVEMTNAALDAQASRHVLQSGVIR